MVVVVGEGTVCVVAGNGTIVFCLASDIGTDDKVVCQRTRVINSDDATSFVISIIPILRSSSDSSLADAVADGAAVVIADYTATDSCVMVF